MEKSSQKWYFSVIKNALSAQSPNISDFKKFFRRKIFAKKSAFLTQNKAKL
jgi:hypothetical protein